MKVSCKCKQRQYFKKVRNYDVKGDGVLESTDEGVKWVINKVQDSEF